MSNLKLLSPRTSKHCRLEVTTQPSYMILRAQLIAVSTTCSWSADGRVVRSSCTEATGLKCAQVFACQGLVQHPSRNTHQHTLHMKASRSQNCVSLKHANACLAALLRHWCRASQGRGTQREIQASMCTCMGFSILLVKQNNSTCN